MNKQDLEEFLTISYDKLVAMGACEPGLKWFAEHFGVNDEWPLGDVAEELRTIEEVEFLCCWYVDEHSEYYITVPVGVKECKKFWDGVYLECDSSLCDAVCYAQYFATYYKIREMEEML